jgi:predicted DsbA family dithiol-disulfide isomerase
MRDHVVAQDKQARELGVSGVPFFIFNNKLAVSGAHEPESLLGAMIEAEKQAATA